MDSSARLIELAGIRNPYELWDVVSTQRYTFPITAELRQQLRSADDPSKLLRFASSIIIEAWEACPDTTGILCTLLSSSHDLWLPDTTTLSELNRLCKRALESDRLDLVACAEPLAFALAAKGLPDVHRRLLFLRVEDRHWREADARRVELYYGSHAHQIPAIVRHLRDPYREGLLRANDASLLMHLIALHNPVVQSPEIRNKLKESLTSVAVVLSRCGEGELLRNVQTCLTERFTDGPTSYGACGLTAALDVLGQDESPGTEAIGLFLERLPDAEERRDLLTAQRIATIDPRMALAKCRHIVEVIAQRVYQRSVGAPGNKPLVNLVHELHESHVIPPRVFANYYPVRKQGNLALHGGQDEATAFRPERVREVLAAAVRIASWYLLEYEVRTGPVATTESRQ